MADSPFIGPTYPLRNRVLSVQRTVNLMPIRLEANERVRWVFKDVPGLVKVDPLNPPTYYTSWPYPIFVDEKLWADLSTPTSGQLWIPPHEKLWADLSIPQSGTLVVTLRTYNNAIADKLWADLSTPQSGTLVSILKVYNNWPADKLWADLSTPQSGTLVVTLVSYPNWPADKLWADLSIPVSGTLA